MRYCSYGLFNLILSRFFIGYWILKRGWISILAPFFVSSESVVLSSESVVAQGSRLTTCIKALPPTSSASCAR